MSRPSYKQIKIITKFLEENPGIAKGILRSAQGRQQTRRKWEEVAKMLNALDGVRKDARSWAKFWADKKYALKKLVTQHRDLANQPGGEGVDSLPPLTELDERLLALLGGSSGSEKEPEPVVPPDPLNPAEPLIEPKEEMSLQTTDEEPCASPTVQTPPIQSPEPPARSSWQQISSITAPRRGLRRRWRPQPCQFDLERRLLRIEERRVAAELANAEALRSIAQALNNIASAITSSAAGIIGASNEGHK